MMESSEVLGGVKPANLVSLVNRTRSCGRNLYQLWQSHHNELSTRLFITCFKVLQTRDRAKRWPDMTKEDLNGIKVTC